MSPKILLLTGSAPPVACGVGDYTLALAAALKRSGQDADVLWHRDWSPGGTLEVFRRLAAERNVILHIQYPTMGYGHSLGPQLCSLLPKCVVTIHEYSLAHSLRKLSLFFFSIRALRVIMTSQFEREALVSAMPWVKKRLRVVPIGSNIPAMPLTLVDRRTSILYFGLIMPRKGLEKFLEFARIIRKKGFQGDLLIVGKIVAGLDEYVRPLFDASKPLGVEWILDRDAEEVSEVLSRAGLSYLPFPDGASERRGSLKAVCAAGLPCITTKSDQTGDELQKTVVFAETPAEAAGIAWRLMNSGDERARLSQQSLDYANKFTWEAIAEAHIRIYRELEAG